MSSRFYSPIGRFEAESVAACIRMSGRQTPSLNMFSDLVGGINQALQQGRLERDLPLQARVAMSLDPYSPQMPALFTMHNKALEALMTGKMPQLLEAVRACVVKGVPVPVIVSCEKYMAKARSLQALLQPRYFGLMPVIVRGNPDLSEPHYENTVLSLPVADSYEALPVKTLEIVAFFQAVGASTGIIKIDDDMNLKDIAALDAAQVAPMFASADYIGWPVRAILLDRLWHYGKCKERVPAIYGKPVKADWARGALYFLSHAASQKLAQHYFRFPACLDGEMYEDKGVGDLLFDNGIMLMPMMIENILGIDSMSGQEREQAPGV